MQRKNKLFARASVPWLLFFFAIPGLSSVHAQSTAQDKGAAKRALIKSLVDSQSYVFEAQLAMPAGGHTRQLSSDFDLTVGKTTVVSYLPYFGRAYVAPIDPAQGGIQFTSKNFDYTVTQGKKGGWSILIKPHDAGDVQQLSMDITEDGYASLRVVSTSKQEISFNGVIEAKRTKRK